MAARIESIYDEDVERMYYEEGNTQQEIADYYGVSIGCIQGRLDPEKKKEYNDKFQQSDKYKKYRETDKYREKLKEYRQTDKHKSYMKKVKYIRRQLGFIPLNKPFIESEFHHYDKEHGIYIPAEIHQSIYHNVFTGQNMELINKEAFEFLEWEMRDKQWEELEEGRGEY